MSERDDGGRAFPRPGQFSTQDGMTLRDWFAGQALVGIAGQSTEFTDALCRNAQARGMEVDQHVAEIAYTLADAMIAERNKP